MDPDAPTAQSVFVHHQLAANRCLVAVTHAIRQNFRTHLCQWISDPHSRLRYRPDGARSWRSVHPDVIAMLREANRDHWAFLEIDRGTQPLARYVAKVRRYARFQRSKAWLSHYPVFPALRVVSLSARRPAGITEFAADVIDEFNHFVYWAQRPSLYVAATAEAELLADPFGDIWRPASGPREGRSAQAPMESGGARGT